MKNRVLIVEDDGDISDVICMNLKYSGYDYVSVADGAEACEFLKADAKFDIAILDVMLPGMDGFELSEHVRDCKIPVLFLTAKADIVSKINGLDLGEDYMVKPFEVLELMARVEKIIARTGKTDKIIEFDKIKINIDDRSVSVSGVDVALQPMEFELLVALVKHKNCAVSRDRLLDEIWGFSYVGGTRTVDTHVSSLRKKLGVDIVAVPKVGYRLKQA